MYFQTRSFFFRAKPETELERLESSLIFELGLMRLSRTRNQTRYGSAV